MKPTITQVLLTFEAPAALLFLCVGCGGKIDALKVVQKKEEAKSALVRQVDAALQVNGDDSDDVKALKKYLQPSNEGAEGAVTLQGFEKNPMIADFENLSLEDKSQFHLPAFGEYPLFSYQSYPGYKVEYSQPIQNAVVGNDNKLSIEAQAQANAAKPLLKAYKYNDGACNEKDLEYRAAIPKYKDLPTIEASYYFCIRYSVLGASSQPVAYGKTPAFVLSYEYNLNL